MPDDAPLVDKTTLTEKPGTAPTPICTIMSDGSVRVTGAQVHAVDLLRVLLQALAGLTERCVTRGMESERLLLRIRDRYAGLDEETEQALSALFPTR